MKVNIYLTNSLSIAEFGSHPFFAIRTEDQTDMPDTYLLVGKGDYEIPSETILREVALLALDDEEQTVRATFQKDLDSVKERKAIFLSLPNLSDVPY